MKLGLSSWAYPWAVGVPGRLPPEPLTPLALLESAAGHGVRVVQIADNLPLHRLEPPELAALRQRADELGIDLEVGTCGIDAAHIRRYLAIATTCGSPFLRVVIDTPERTPSESETVAALREVAPDCDAANVVLAIENHDRFPAATLRRILERLGSERFGICLDTVNSLAAGETVEQVLDALEPWVVNLHVKDFIVERADHRMGFTVRGAPAGHGVLDLAALLDRLQGHERTPNAILEQWPPYQGTPGATVAMEEAWVRASLADLRSRIPS